MVTSISTPALNVAPREQKETRLNSLYLIWKTDPSSVNGDLLFQEILSYAERSIRKDTPKFTDAEDAAAESAMEIWKSIDKFDGRVLFKTWAYAIIRNTSLDFIRKVFVGKNKAHLEREKELGEKLPTRKRELPLLGFKGYCGDGQYTTSSLPSMSEQEGDGETDGGSGKQEIPSKRFIEKTENDIIDRIDGEKQAINNRVEAEKQSKILDLLVKTVLNRDDQNLLHRIREGEGQKEIADSLHLTPEQIYKRFSKIVQILKEDIPAYSCTLHTCQPSFESSYEITGLSIFQHGSYQLLPAFCRCRKSITHVEAVDAVHCGEAWRVYKLVDPKRQRSVG
jgi:RNA polymerase sigma factor (sigma-70 family)